MCRFARGSFRPESLRAGFMGGRFALTRWVVSPVSCFARELFHPLLLQCIIIIIKTAVVVDIAIVNDAKR